LIHNFRFLATEVVADAPSLVQEKRPAMYQYGISPVADAGKTVGIDTWLPAAISNC
jgi:hypothetical protein